MAMAVEVLIRELDAGEDGMRLLERCRAVGGEEEATDMAMVDASMHEELIGSDSHHRQIEHAQCELPLFALSSRNDRRGISDGVRLHSNSHHRENERAQCELPLFALSARTDPRGVGDGVPLHSGFHHRQTQHA